MNRLRLPRGRGGVPLLAALLVALSCSSGQPVERETAASASQINGAGATFPYPIYSKWFDEYSKLRPDVRVNYQSQGSGAGIRQLTNQTVFFGASDGPMTETQLSAAPGKILHFPTVLGADVPVYNIPNLNVELKFGRTVLADIFLGKVTRWDDPAIAKDNPGVTLPPLDITVVHRSDASGTTYIWVDYLAKASPEWKTKVGVSTAVNWPIGIGGKGNEGVAGLVSLTPGSIGYVELIFALQNKMSYGSVQNAAGSFVKATADSVTAAAASAQMPSDFRISITNAPGADAYPISSFTWLLMYEDPKNKEHAKVMIDFMKWALTEGQRYAVPLGYAPLPPDVIQMELQALQTVKTT